LSKRSKRLKQAIETCIRRSLKHKLEHPANLYLKGPNSKKPPPAAFFVAFALDLGWA
jgi:hypothetical protein